MNHGWISLTIHGSQFTLHCFNELVFRHSYKRPTGVALQGHHHTFPDDGELIAAAGVGLLQAHDLGA